VTRVSDDSDCPVVEIGSQAATDRCGKAVKLAGQEVADEFQPLENG